MKEPGKKPLEKTDEGLSGEAQDSGPVSVPMTLLGDLQSLIESARIRVAVGVNTEMVLPYWDIGKRIQQEILGDQRADYGKRVISGLSDQLTLHYGRGFTRANLFHMIRFAEVFPDRAIVYTLSGQLSWSHFRTIIYVDDPLARDFYIEMCRLERWSVRTLQAKIQGMLFERTALSRKPEVLAQQELSALREEDRLTPYLVFRDPYILDFLRLKDTYSEDDLESAILQEIEQFLLELGAGFTFVARQKRMVIGNEDFYLDLLFFHRKLRRLIAIGFL